MAISSKPTPTIPILPLHTPQIHVVMSREASSVPQRVFFIITSRLPSHYGEKQVPPIMSFSRKSCCYLRRDDPKDCLVYWSTSCCCWVDSGCLDDSLKERLRRRWYRCYNAVEWSDEYLERKALNCWCYYDCWKANLESETPSRYDLFENLFFCEESLEI
jgi:hypothetical protein